MVEVEIVRKSSVVIKCRLVDFISEITETKVRTRVFFEKYRGYLFTFSHISR